MICAQTNQWSSTSYNMRPRKSGVLQLDVTLNIWSEHLNKPPVMCCDTFGDIGLWRVGDKCEKGSSFCALINITESWICSCSPFCCCCVHHKPMWQVKAPLRKLPFVRGNWITKVGKTSKHLNSLCFCKSLRHGIHPIMDLPFRNWRPCGILSCSFVQRRYLGNWAKRSF